MNGEVCCILGICCPPAQRAEALAKSLSTDAESPLHGQPDEAEAVATYLFKHFDLAPAGKLQPLVAAVSAMAKASHGGGR